MRIMVVNPNTTAEMTAKIELSARAVAGPGTHVEAVTSTMGPASIESHYDEALSVPGLLAAIHANPADGYVIACFGDPGLEAAREVADGPVVGIAEAAMHAAALLGRGFSVVTTLDRTRGRAWDLAARYVAAGVCRGVHACDIPVLELDRDPTVTDRVVALARPRSPPTGPTSSCWAAPAWRTCRRSCRNASVCRSSTGWRRRRCSCSRSSRSGCPRRSTASSPRRRPSGTRGSPVSLGDLCPSARGGSGGAGSVWLHSSQAVGRAFAAAECIGAGTWS
ncbi:hypothetical protein GCM10027610_088600 [Dactylosporangium cerinum]